MNMIVPVEDECGADKDKVLCIIRDMTDPNTSTRFSVNLQASYTCQALIAEVASKLGYQAGSFSLTYEQPQDGELREVDVSNTEDLTLANLCVNVGNRKKNNFTVMDKDGCPPIKIPGKTSGDSSNFDYKETSFETNSTFATAASTPVENTWSSSQSSTYGGFSYASAVTSDTGYVGLVNQAMTCYLNSLLQTLYMTPEFRNAVYRWIFDGGQDDAFKSIPFQLQRLFLQLQTCNKRAVETTDITKSFGWDSSEAWQQHDVQELMRVMFDALEKKWKRTPQADLINKLYQGKMQDYVKCLECDYESARTDCFLDIPLTIRPFGSNQSYTSVEESLQAFVTPETLNGNNQYFCEKCNKKCDAHKGLKFTKFPYLLTLQLKRFDFDYNTMHRIKLNQRLTFPEVLNLNHLVNDNITDVPPPEGSSVDGSGDACANTRHLGPEAANGDEAGIIEDTDTGYSASGGSNLSNSEAAANHKNAQDMGSRGPFVYELYSIMIHSGSAAGGHYYAYIKSFQDGQWYSFNDQHVSTISFDDIQKTYGGSIGSRGYYSSTFASSTNAYMLVYRQIDKSRNEDFTIQDQFSTELQNELNKLQNMEEEEKRLKELEKSTCKIKLVSFHPVYQKQIESKLEVHKDCTLNEATRVAWKLLEFDQAVPLDCVRLVKYDDFNDYIERSYDGFENTAMSVVLDGVKSSYMHAVYLEVKNPQQSFHQYKPGGITVKVIVVDIEREHIDGPVPVRAYLNQTVNDFKHLVHEALQLPVENMRCVLEKYYNDLKLLKDPSKTLKSEGFFKSNKVFVECSGLEDPSEEAFAGSKYEILLDRYEHTIKLTVGLPVFIDRVNETCVDAAAAAATAVVVDINIPNVDNQSNGSDKGFGDGSESDARTLNSDTSDSLLSAATPLKSNGGSGDAASAIDMHAFIGDSIQQQQQQLADTTLVPGSSSNGGGAGCDQSSQDDSESTVTSLDSSSTVTSSSTITLSEPPALDTVNSQLNSIVQAAEGEPLLHTDSLLGVTSSPESAQSVDSTDMLTSSAPDTCAAKTSYSADTDEEYSLRQQDEECSRYFTAKVNVDAESKERSLTVFVDKRITVRALKRQLEQFVGTNSDMFKVYKVYSNAQEFECTRQSETLNSYGDDSRINIKLGRALKKGENRIKVYQLLLHEPDPIKFAFEVIIARSMTVAELRRLMQQDLKEQCNISVSIDRLRVRKKTWKNPSTIFIDKQKFDHDIPLLASSELFAEILEQPERVLIQSQVSLYVRKWSPSTFKVGPFQEVILENLSSECLMKELTLLSGMDEENIEYAKAKGTFPYEISVLEIDNDLHWNPNVKQLNAYPVSICDDGCVVYFRDKTEALLELSDSERTELQQKENIRLSKFSTYSAKIYSRKEKALKIYTDDSPVKASSSSSGVAMDTHDTTLHSSYTASLQVENVESCQATSF